MRAEKEPGEKSSGSFHVRMMSRWLVRDAVMGAPVSRLLSPVSPVFRVNQA